MAAHGHHPGQTANVRLLALWEEDHTEDFETQYRGITLAKTNEDTWTVEDDDQELDEFSKSDFDGAREWINHINGLAKHGADYLAIVEADR